MSEQEYLEMQTKYQKQMENEKKLYDKIVNWRKSLSDLEYSVSLSNPGHYPNPAKDIQILQYTTTADYVLNGVICMCHDLLDIDFTQPTEVVDPESDPS